MENIEAGVSWILSVSCWRNWIRVEPFILFRFYHILWHDFRVYFITGVSPSQWSHSGLALVQVPTSTGNAQWAQHHTLNPAPPPHLSKPTIFSITIARLSEPITWDAGVRSVKHGSGWGVVYFSSMYVYVDLHLFGWVFKVPGPAGLERACRSCVGSILTPVLCLAPSHQQKSLRKVSLGLKLLYLIPSCILYNYLVCSTSIT